jgi:hypothetical protein
MLEMARRSYEKKVGMRLGKYAKAKEEINWKPSKCTSALAVNSKRRTMKKFEKIRKITSVQGEEKELRNVRGNPVDPQGLIIIIIIIIIIIMALQPFVGHLPLPVSHLISVPLGFPGFS